MSWGFLGVALFGSLLVDLGEVLLLVLDLLVDFLDLKSQGVFAYLCLEVNQTGEIAVDCVDGASKGLEASFWGLGSVSDQGDLNRLK